MTGGSLLDLSARLHAPEREVREAAWDELIARQTGLLMSVARSFHGDRDQVMERYAYVLEKLRERNFHRLRAFQPQGRASFSTWLTVAARRLCLDHERARYGRDREPEQLEHKRQNTLLRSLRRRLADSEGEFIEVDQLSNESAGSADARMIRSETDDRLRGALATLTPRDRLLLSLRFEDDLSAARIAETLGLPTPFHVYRHLNAILATLRRFLVSRGIDASTG
jgi:RNA polymerase sigma factor (sigma-70 family)